MRNPFAILRNRAREEALEWLARLKRGLRPDEGPQLLSWLKRRSHRRLIAKAAYEWHDPEVLAVLSAIFPIDPVSFEPWHRTLPVKLGVMVTPVFIAMTLVRVVGFLVHHEDDGYATTPKETRRLALEDGTRVALNRGTAINVAYEEHMRSVLLARGEALFTVANQPHRPFNVRAGSRTFETDSGTFDVSLTDQNRLSVIVLKGTVTVSPPRNQQGGSYYYDADPRAYQPILIKPLQMLVIEPDDESGQTLTEKDVRSRLSWQGGT
jgi:transmembrane sensor